MKKSVLKLLTVITSSVMVLGTASTAFGGQYTVVKGDYLSKIAPKYSTTWRTLADMNKLANPDLIFPGQVLQVPDIVTAKVPEKTEPAAETPKTAVETPKTTETNEEVPAVLTSLAVDDITLTGNGITPAFDPSVKDYTMNVQSDIYGVKVSAKASEGAAITIDGETAEDGTAIVKLPDGYADYDSEVVQKIVIDVNTKSESSQYTVTVTRACDNDTYALFKQDTYKDEATGVEMPYELYVPTDYDQSKTYPIVFALHGSGQRSQSTDMVLKRYQMATIWAKDSEAGHNECIILAPQCASQDNLNNWTNLMKYQNGVAENPYDLSEYGTTAYNLLQKVMGEYSIDKDRVYMTGLSAGGFATFELAAEHPDTFAAILPVAGAVNPEKASNLKDMPIWIFNAEDDPLVTNEQYISPTINALNSAGIQYKSTIYSKGEIFTPSAHFSWTPCYASSEVRDWLFQQSK
jgi:predicted peptidase